MVVAILGITATVVLEVLRVTAESVSGSSEVLPR